VSTVPLLFGVAIVVAVVAVVLLVAIVLKNRGK